jgi:hypothetical protein
VCIAEDRVRSLALSLARSILRAFRFGQPRLGFADRKVVYHLERRPARGKSKHAIVSEHFWSRGGAPDDLMHEPKPCTSAYHGPEVCVTTDQNRVKNRSFR